MTDKNVFSINVLVKQDPITDEERATVSQDIEAILKRFSVESATAVLFIDFTSREVYVMMTMLKEQQDALAATLTNV